LKSQAEQANNARKQVEQTAATERAEANKLRHELEQHRKNASRDQKSLQLELVKAHEALSLATASADAGNVAKAIAQANQQQIELQAEIEALRQQLANATPETFQDRILLMEQRVDKAEKKASATELRLQAAQREVAEANAHAAHAQTQIVESKADTAAATSRVEALTSQITTLGQQLVELEIKMNAGAKDTDVEMFNITATGAQLQAETVAKLAAAELQGQRLEQALAEQTRLCADATAAADAAHVGLASAQRLLAMAQNQHADANVNQLPQEPLSLNSNEQLIAARKDSADAIAALTKAEQKKQQAIEQVEQANLRASAADTMAKSMAKDVADSLRRAVESDAKNKQLRKELAAAEKRCADIEAARQKDLMLVSNAKDSAAQLQREVDQLRSSLVTEQAATAELTNRRNKLQKESGEQQTLIAQLQKYTDEVNAALEEYEAQAEALSDKITDLESQILIDATAHADAIKDLKKNASAAINAARSNAQTAVAEAQQQAQTKISQVEQQAAAMVSEAQTTLLAVQAELVTARKTADESAAPLRARIALLEAELANSTQQVTETSNERPGDQARSQGSIHSEEHDRLMQRLHDAEQTAERLQSKVDAADMAMGKAFALERQLDEALSRLARLERGRPLDYSTSINDEERIAAVQADLSAAQQQVQVLQDELALKTKQVTVAIDELASANKQARHAKEEMDGIGKRLIETVYELDVVGKRSQELQQALLESEAAREKIKLESDSQHGILGEQLQQANQQLATFSSTQGDEERLRRQMENLQGELQRAQSLLQARETELAALQNPSADRNTTSNGFDEVERTSSAADLSRYEPPTTELVALRNELSLVKEQLASSEKAIDGDNEITGVRGALPHGFLENLAILEESIDSLRANLRSASDEASAMPKTDAVGLVTSALGQAIEDISRARRALRDMTELANSSPIN
jgi:chromosome segregation ATPase